MNWSLPTFLLCSLATLLPASAGPGTSANKDSAFTADQINSTQWTGTSDPAIIRAQILLARAHLSPGEIDGQMGDNLSRALKGFQYTRKLPITGNLDEATWTALNADSGPSLVSYTLTESDVAGPFAEIPQDMAKQAKLKTLSYGTAEEAIGERFHVQPALLKRLNKGLELRAGEQLLVPDPGQPAQGKAGRVIVTTEGVMTVWDEAGNFLAQYPCSSGSEHDPLPLGEWKITEVYKNPTFHYNPKLFWDAAKGESRATIKPGPNNPVGVVWIDLTREHYGIHGTPRPDLIGHTQSHGCIRLTNWDVTELAGLVSKDTPVTCQK